MAASHEDLQPLLESLRAVFAATSVALAVQRDGTWANDLVSGLAIDDFENCIHFEIDDEHRLYVKGASLDAQDEQLISAFARRIAAGLRSQIIARDANQLQEIAEAESCDWPCFELPRRSCSVLWRRSRPTSRYSPVATSDVHSTNETPSSEASRRRFVR